MQIRLSRAAESSPRPATTPMSVDEFLARFPEVPGDLRHEPVLEEYVRAFGPLLRLAEKPSPCVARAGGDAPHAFYVRLVTDLAVYGMGLARRERTLGRLGALLDEYRRQPATFACSLVPQRPPGMPRPTCG
jgi:hypothetical protein